MHKAGPKRAKRWTRIASAILAVLGALLVVLAAQASPAYFGLCLAVAAWLFVLGLVVLPVMALGRRLLLEAED